MENEQTWKLTSPEYEENYYKKIFEEYGKTKKDVEEYVNILTEWSKTQKHFPEIPSRNGIRFSIVSCKFSIERAKEKLDMYFTIRNLMPEIYRTHPLSDEMILFNKLVVTVPLPKPTEKYERILVTKIGPNYSPDMYKHENYLIQLTHMIEIILQEDSCFNFHQIFDCSNMKLSHTTMLSPAIVKKLTVCLEKVYANRLATIYIVNFSSVLEPLVNNIVRPLAPAKLRNRIYIMEGYKGIHKIFDKSILPKDYGGDEKSLDELRDIWMKKYEEWKPRFDYLETMVVDETKRPAKLKNDDILGYYGNFRKISVD